MCVLNFFIIFSGSCSLRHIIFTVIFFYIFFGTRLSFI